MQRAAFGVVECINLVQGAESWMQLAVTGDALLLCHGTCCWLQPASQQPSAAYVRFALRKRWATMAAGPVSNRSCIPTGSANCSCFPSLPAPAGVEGDLTKRWGSKLFWVLYWMALEAWVVVYPGIVAICMFGEMTAPPFHTVL